MPISPRWVPLIPLVFVLLWSTGFIAAKFALPFIEPFTLLLVRMLITMAVLVLLIQFMRTPWPNPRQAVHQMVVGSLIHAAYLGGVFAAIKLQMPAGVASLIVGLQPILTALLAWLLLSSRLRISQWFGLLLGLAGVSLVIIESGNLNDTPISPGAMLAILVALFGISIGTLYQKRYGQGSPLLTGSFFQYLATAIWMGLLSFSLETREITWSLPLLGALAWLVIVLSIVAILLLMVIIREGEAARVASYFYLVPPVTAIQGWLFFGEQLNLLALLGVAAAVFAVYLVIKAPRWRH